MNCLDAETLAAWMDGGLKGAPLKELEVHVAGCDRCQMLLGAMGRTRAAIPAVPPARAPRRWLAWAVPLAAAATALAVWVAVPEQRSAPQIPPSSPSAARADSERSVQPSAPASLPPTGEPSASERRPAALPPLATPRPPAAPKATEPVSPQTAVAAPLQKSEGAADVVEAAPVAAAPPESGREQAPGAAGNRIAGRVAALASPSAPSIQTLCGPGWTSGPADVGAQLAAGSSPSPNVCWVVGRGGVIRLSTNRQSWQTIRFPDTADLSGVQASDARTVTVTMVDGRSFRTVDGGMTWMPE